MTDELKEQLIHRLKSLLWRIGSYVVVAALAALVDVLGVMQVDASVIAIIALVCGEITKYVNTYSA